MILMNKIGLLENDVQNYVWGSRAAIADLLGRPSPSSEPEAELWMGAHPKAPSRVQIDGVWTPLPDVIARDPAGVLGKRVAGRFGGKLPFLFKVLAAAEPLSIQAHPDLAQARQGFARENERGVRLEAPDRNYRDDNHKPEIICALTPFWGLNGFRSVGDILDTFDIVGPAELAPEIKRLAAHPSEQGLREFFTAIMTMDVARKRRAVAEAVARAATGASGDPVCEWMQRLQGRYPGDIGVLSPMLLNLVELEPGQAMFLHARRLHAYLDGTGVELMANSDNVLRGGLTPKHVDVPELLRVLRFDETAIDVLTPEPRAPGERVYRTDVDEFRLSVIEVDERTSYASAEERSVEIAMCTKGSARIAAVESGETVTVSRGMSFLVPASVRRYRIEGTATLYRASVPPDSEKGE
jgi:mannose-6-phosphate isomerase